MGCCSLKKQDQSNSITSIMIKLNNSKIKNASGKVHLIEKLREKVLKSNYFLSPKSSVDIVPEINRRSNSTQFFDEKEFKF